VTPALKPPRVLAQAGAALAWLAGAFVVSLLLAAVLPMAVGMHTYTVRSGSMEPAIETGDVIVTKSIAPADARVGDIVTFVDPDGSGSLITHRVRAISTQGDRTAVVTRGDANNAFERWSVPSDGSIGQVAYRLPMLGRALAPLSSTLGKAGLIVVPALLLCALGLRRIWRPERELPPPGTKEAGGR
jgi:signal peptidase